MGARQNLEVLLDEEELYWRQRSRVDWLKCGDRNTTWFHRKATQRKQRNKIAGLLNERGDWAMDHAGVESIISDYFMTLFTSSYCEGL